MSDGKKNDGDTPASIAAASTRVRVDSRAARAVVKALREKRFYETLPNLKCGSRYADLSDNPLVQRTVDVLHAEMQLAAAAQKFADLTSWQEASALLAMLAADFQNKIETRKSRGRPRKTKPTPHEVAVALFYELYSERQHNAPMRRFVHKFIIKEVKSGRFVLPGTENIRTASDDTIRKRITRAVAAARGSEQLDRLWTFLAAAKMPRRT